MVEIIEEGAQLVIRIGEQEFARYNFGSNLWKPYLYPIRAANGLSLVADAPVDHRHHHGFWVGHGRVNGLDFWQARHNSGRIVHRSFEKVVSGGELGSFTEKCDWISPTGDVVLTDTRTFAFHDTPPDARLFDFEIVLRAPNNAPVSLEPTNEAGIPYVRLAEGLTVKSGGTLVNASGQRNEKGTYGQRSPWIDGSGKIGRLQCGIALFDHPDNPAYPTPWFTRDYGPVSPNFGLFQEEPLVIAPRRPLRLRYRVYAHSGDAETGRVAAFFNEFLQSLRQVESSEQPVESPAGRSE